LFLLPDTPVVIEKEPAEELKDMVVDDIIPTPVSEPVVVATPTVAKPIKRLNDPIDLDYERYFDDDYDIMGNPINYDVSHFRSEVVNKFDALTKDMYLIQDIPVYRHRLCELPTKGRKNFITQDVDFLHGDNFRCTNFNCTNILKL
jgi:hypothetical protein